MQDFLPVTKKEMKQRGWEQVDFAYITGDAYVDHPSLVLRSSADCWRVVGIKWGSFLSLTGERRRVFRYLESLDWDFWCLREIWTLW